MANLSEEAKSAIMVDGVKDIKWGNRWYPISRALIEDGRDNLILRGGKDSVKVNCPIRLIHAIGDEEVPYTTALTIAEVVTSKNVDVMLVKDASHVLDEEADFNRMKRYVRDCWREYLEFDLTSPMSG